MTETCDVAIIGAGSAGLSALREVRKRTEDFVIIDPGPYGTTCARVGCMPSKALIEAANAVHHATRIDEFGARIEGSLRVDVPAVLRRVRRLRDEFVAGILPLTQDIGERRIEERARFVAADTLQAGGRRIRARAIIIATGTEPIVPAEWRAFGARVLTTDALFEQPDLPARIAVIGMGSVGTEIAQSLARLGLRVSAFGKSEHIAGLTDRDVNAAAVGVLRDELALHLGSTADVRVEGEELLVRGGGHEARVECVLAALGRMPRLEGLDLEKTGLQLNEHGLPTIDRHSMRAGSLPIYLAGDVTEGLAVLHQASDDGHVAGINSASKEMQRFQRRVPLGIVFSDPGIAIAGRARAQLPPETIVGRVDFARQGRSRMAGENRGLLHVYVERSSGLILGAEMCAPRAEHFAHLIALAIERRCSVHDLLRMPFYHPVYEEGLRTALRDAARQLDFAPHSDLASCDALGAAALD